MEGGIRRRDPLAQFPPISCTLAAKESTVECEICSLWPCEGGEAFAVTAVPDTLGFAHRDQRCTMWNGHLTVKALSSITVMH